VSLRKSRVLISLCAFGGFLLIVIARGWNGLDQIPSDPGYDYIGERVQLGISVVEVEPYLYAEQSTLASLASLLPLEHRGLFLTLASHGIWALCALVIFRELRRHGLGAVISVIGGLLLVTTPWAAQSAIGNYGNVRWPILVAAGVIFAAEISSKRPRAMSLLLAAVVATLSNPLHPLLIVPLLFGVVTLAADHRRALAFGAVPLGIGLALNLVNAGASGHSEKISSFWDGAGLFWMSGQILPISVAAAGLVLSARNIRRWNQRQLLAVNLFVLVVLIVAASYQLGGIADRYFVTPASLAAIGVMVVLADFRSRSVVIANVLSIVLAVILLVPTVRWFFIFPYLRSADGWSSQVERGREQCATEGTAAVELITSNGSSRTDPIPCDELLQQ